MAFNISKGNTFTLFSVLVFLISIFGVYRFHDTIIKLPLDRNMPVLTAFAGVFLAVNILMYLIVFRKETFAGKPTLRTLVLFSLFLMLIFTVLSETISRYITAFFAISAVIYGLSEKQFRPHPLFYFIGGYYFYQFIGSIWTIDYNLAFRFLGKGISFVIIPVAFSCFIPQTEERNKLLKILFRFLIVYLLFSLVAYLFQVYYNGKDVLVGFGFKKVYLESDILPYDDFYAILGWAGYYHPTFVSFLLTIMYGVGYYFWRTDKLSTSGITTFELILFTIISYVLIIFLQSRIGMILFPFGIFLTVLMTVRKRKAILYTYLTVAAVIFILAFIYVYFYQDKYFYDAKRVEQTEIMISYIKNHLWTGTGTGGMRLINTFPTAHNQILGDLFHLGIPGLISFLILIAATTYYTIKDRNYMLLYFLLIFFVVMQIDQMLSIQKGITYFTLFVGLLIRPEFKRE